MMNKTKKLAKGALVKLDETKCFTKKQGGGREYPLVNQRNDENGTYPAARPVNEEETRAWYSSDASKGMNSAGETKLPPQSTMISLRRDRLYHVLRARCRIRLGWGNPTPGMTKVLCTETGEIAYIERSLLTVI